MKALVHRLGLLVLALLLGCSGSGGTSDVALDAASRALSDNAARTITILHVNDSHSVLDAIGPKDANFDGTLGGLTKAATVIAGIRNEHPHTLLLHAGDVFEGDLSFVATNGVVELQILKQLGLDAFALGNHEFDYGPDLLAATLAGADFAGVPVLAANLTGNHQPLSSFVTDHVIKDVGGVRIGIFGLTTPYDPLAQTAPFTLSDDFGTIVSTQVTALRAAGADVVILLSHLPGAFNAEIASSNAIDFIIAAHDEYEQTFKKFTPGETQIVQAGHFYQWVGKLDLVVKKGKITHAAHKLLRIDAEVPREPSVLAAVQQVEQGVNDLLGFDAFHTPIAEAASDLENLWTPDMGPRRDLAVGSLAADALEAQFAPVDLGMTTSGFLNDRIYKGPVVANDLFRSLPYGINPALFFPVTDAVLPDPVLKVTVSGLQLYAGLEVALDVGEIPQVSDGTLVCFDLTAAPYERMRFIILGEAPVTPATPAVSVAMNIIMWKILNDASQGFGLGEIPLPGDFDPSVSQFSALLAYATGKELSRPAQARVLDLPGNGCQGLLGP